MSAIAYETPYPVRFDARSLDKLIPAFQRIAAEYAQSWGLPCILADLDGRIVAGAFSCADCSAGERDCADARRRAIAESVRWGEPSVLLCPHGQMIWAVPVMENNLVLGGLVAAHADTDQAAGTAPALSTADIRRAALDLLVRAEQANLTNGALLELHRLSAQRESQRAEAIHEIKGQNYQSIRDLYLKEEPDLIAAIKRGDRGAARESVNRVLVGIYFLGRDRPLLLKSFILELVVMMSRTAVEAGGDPTELLGANYSSFADLARIDSEEELCAWLVAMLERIMDAIKTHHQYPISVLLGAAMTYMREHLHEELSRDAVAGIACLSPSHFSRAIKQAFGQSFTELLARMRVEKARELLVLTEKSLVQICMDCGFSDQSYFTKVFQKYTGRPPGEYRRLHRPIM